MEQDQGDAFGPGLAEEWRCIPGYPNYDASDLGKGGHS